MMKFNRTKAGWTPEDPPAAMRSLPPAVRRKAVEAANELLRDGVDESRAVRIATAKARAWALQQQRQTQD